MKILFFITLFCLTLNASYLFDNYNICIEDYYIQNAELYYLRSDNNMLYSTTTTKLAQYIYDGYSYDSTTNKCSRDLTLGLEATQYNFLYALVGLIIGFVLFWLVPKR